MIRIGTKSTRTTQGDPRTYPYFETVSDPGTPRQLLGVDGSIFCRTPDPGPPLPHGSHSKDLVQIETFTKSVSWVDPLSTSVRIDRISSNTTV